MNAMQTVFGFFEGSLNRSGVLSLCVFKPEVIHKEGFEVGKLRSSGGQHQESAYSTWLKFYTPLSHSVSTFCLEN